MKKIVFGVFSLLILAAGVLVFEKIESKILDDRWGVVVAKIAIAVLLIIVYGICLRYLAHLIGIDAAN